jgi:hypothetical protein
LQCEKPENDAFMCQINRKQDVLTFAVFKMYATKINQNQPNATKINQNQPKSTKRNQTQPKSTKRNQYEI